MRIPDATYRIQINPDFGFASVAAILDYLASLGVSHVYASPVFKARKGSRHGYDIVDPNSLNLELGSDTDFHDLMDGLKRRDMGWIQDIVPNHMALDGDNAMLMDVLENFTDSDFYGYFDIDWDYHPNTEDAKLNMPFLARPYEECMARGEISLTIEGDRIAIAYRDLNLSVKLATYSDLINLAVALSGRDAAPAGITRLRDLFADASQGSGGGSGAARAKAALRDLYASDARVRECLDQAIRTANASATDLSEEGVLHGLLARQVFRLIDWRAGSAQINYRRFFNVSRLICLRMEVPRVFQHHHRLVREWLTRGLIDGVRVDHIDGLYDAHGYVSRVRAAAPEAYIVAEKILGPDETLSPHWDVQGTTGYDFLNHVNGVLCRRANAEIFERIYRDFTGLADTYDDLVYENKRMIVETHFQSAVEKLARMAAALCRDMPEVSPSGHEGLKRALTGLIACFPVYRTYIGPEPPHPADSRRIEEAAGEARRRIPEAGSDIEVIKHLILAAAGVEDSDLVQRRLRFVRTLQQYTGPVMAKGFEDTVLYVYNRLLSLNEVGGEPRDFGVSLGDFHGFNQRRLAEWPHSMNATSTHDTKRGEDVRARINVLSEIPDEFAEHIWKWRDLNAPHAGQLEGVKVPGSNDEYFLYQTMIGAYPFDEEGRAGFLGRLEVYMIKAMREAKSLTSWAEPDTAYENLFTGFMKAILDPARSPEFFEDFMGFAGKVHRYAVYDSLSQTLLKITAPGVPDFYQGSELWDLSLVDPDNRRAVDFGKRSRLLETVGQRMQGDPYGLLRDLLLHPEDGAVKLLLVHLALSARREHVQLFTNGAYIPIDARGGLRDHVICFARRQEAKTAIIIAPRFLTSVVPDRTLPLGPEVWKDTEVILPGGFPAHWKNAITGMEIRSDGRLVIGSVLTDFPVALLVGSGPS
jgi:(1->4)-alpha-D-glucan 1-alpha-D-glucosylmutase